MSAAAPDGGTRERADTGAIEIAVFDCDSTLSRIEGIVWLAERAGVGAEVERMTRRAMAGEVPLESVYERRLGLARPAREDLAALARAYADAVVEDAAAVIASLEALGVETWVVSGGLLPAVRPFAVSLGMEPARVRAVEFDPERRDPWLAAAAHPLATEGGKGPEIRRLARGRPAALVGDGASDLAARRAVRCFVGYGGVARHAAVRAGADGWIASASLAPALPLLRPDAGARLTGTSHEEVWAKGKRLVASGDAAGGCPPGGTGPTFAP